MKQVHCLTHGWSFSLFRACFCHSCLVDISNKRALHQRRSIGYLVVTLLLFFPLPQTPVLPRAMEPQYKHQQSQQQQAHGQGQQHGLQDPRGTVRSYRERQKQLWKGFDKHIFFENNHLNSCVWKKLERIMSLLRL